MEGRRPGVFSEVISMWMFDHLLLSHVERACVFAHLPAVALDIWSWNIYFVMLQKEFEILQAHIMMRIVGMIQKHLTIILIKFHFYVKQDVSQNIE
jgi:hypothetical protein